MLDEGRYKTPIQSKHNLGWKANQFKSDNASMLVHGSGVSQYPQIYEKFKNYCYHIHMWKVIQVKMFTSFCKINGLLHDQNQLKHLLWCQ